MSVNRRIANTVLYEESVDRVSKSCCRLRLTIWSSKTTTASGGMAGPQRYLTAVELVLLFTPRLVGNNAGVHPIARGIEPLLHGSHFRNLLQQ